MRFSCWSGADWITAARGIVDAGRTMSFDDFFRKERRVDDLTMELFFKGTPKTQNVSAVVGDLEGSESISRIGQFSMHGSPPAQEFFVQ